MSSPLPLIPRPESVEIRPGHFRAGPETGVRGPAQVAALAREVLGITGAGGEIEFRLVDEPEWGAEGYRLSVSETGVRATATAVHGLRWAVQTLRQLSPGEGEARFPCVEITDRPRYPWRGAHLDVARWFHPLPFLRRYVDLLALHKLNVLHLHLTDDQGWRFEVRRFPRLTGIGGFRAGSSAGHLREGRTDGVPHGGFYTQRELRDLVAYAEARGVSVMPEVDAPGHMQAAIAAYPWLGNDPRRRLPVREQWGISRHVLNVSDETVAFVRHVLDELMAVFPFSHVHIGGDEVPGDEWADSAAARARAAAEGLEGTGRLLGWWSRLLASHVQAAGRRAAVWDEVVEEGVPSATVFAWQDAGRVEAALRAGYEVVAAPCEYTYLDYAEADSPGEPPAIGGGLPLEKVYLYQPPPGVLGVQGQVWCEYLPTTDLVEWRAFPRLAALAEVGWSAGRKDPAGFRRRLRGHLPLLDRLGVNYRPLTAA
ncbi:beta-N-acetylhexosaminidase [Streptomyces hoynatensis]|uniref:beta-N-acetylhexosaminidase n=1 Tax=Streptomyces hoynatensis TaxID=1141874 RepID=A0A3A9Z9F5_9ACTN|nr:beta-N-acetylhexosaminidase [Streptomyces hoynatensis]RKN44915.1 beta-N-acetylhexosaminidase [Streptomyces hoynatensis]